MDIYEEWWDGLDRCKMFEIYLLGNIFLLNVILVCMGFDNISLSWIGVVKESCENEDKGK